MKASELITLLQARIDAQGDFDMEDFLGCMNNTEKEEWWGTHRQYGETFLVWLERWLSGLPYDSNPDSDNGGYHESL